MDLLFHHVKYLIDVLRPRNKHMISPSLVLLVSKRTSSSDSP